MTPLPSAPEAPAEKSSLLVTDTTPREVDAGALSRSQRTAAGCALVLALCVAAVCAACGAGALAHELLLRSELGGSLKGEDCHDVVEDGNCYRDIAYLQADVRVNPQRYPGLGPSSNFKAIQKFLHYQHRCPKPCWEEDLSRLHDRHTSHKDSAMDGRSLFNGKLHEDSMAHGGPGRLNGTHAGNVSRESEEVGRRGDSENDEERPGDEEDAANHDKRKDNDKDTKDTKLHKGEEDEGKKVRKGERDREGEKAAEEEKREDEEESKEEKKKQKKKEDECEQPDPDSTCFSSIMWVMESGLEAHPAWFPGISFESTFSEVQAFLTNDPQAECPPPCDCWTALPGEDCHSAITWVLEKGVVDHPDWFEGITAASSRRAVQQILYQQDPDSGCERPCQERKAKKANFISLFCFLVTAPSGNEAELVEMQIVDEVGIAACDSFAIFCQENVNLAGVDAIVFQPAAVGQPKDSTAGRAQLFMGVWEAIKRDARFKKHDWTIKVDPDTVLLPHKLREHLSQPIYAGALQGKGAYVKDCSKWKGDGWPTMFGAVEAISRPAVEAYLQDAEACSSKVQWEGMGEDLFLTTCFDDVLLIPGVVDLSIAGDDLCVGEGEAAGESTGADCGDGLKTAYHPFKTTSAWRSCYDQVMQGEAALAAQSTAMQSAAAPPAQSRKDAPRAPAPGEADKPPSRSAWANFPF